MELARKPIGAAAAIFDDQGRILLVRHTYGKLNWDLPGGAAEATESAAETALREVQEETGLHAVVERMVGQVYYDRRYDMHHFVFVCRATGEPVVNSPEISQWGYWPVDQLPRPISDFTARRIRAAVSPQATGVVEIGPRVWLE